MSVVVASKDRLCRFAFEPIEYIFRTHGTQLVVLGEEDKSPESEFAEDVLAIMQVFTCRWNGKRRYRRKSGQDQGLPDAGAESQVGENGGYDKSMSVPL